MSQKSPQSHNTLWGHLWRYFLSGVLLSAPILLTFYISWSLITWLDGHLKSLLPGIDWVKTGLFYNVPGVGLLMAFVFFVLVGSVATGVLGRWLVTVGETVLNRMPLVRGLYGATKQIVQAVFRRDKSSFREVVLIAYPRPGLWTIGFITNVTEGEVKTVLSSDNPNMSQPQDLVSVFIPTTPNPTSGFLIFVPRSDLRPLSMNVDDGFKLVVSMGLVLPEHNKKKE
jgi:uncharacterized membrane protein